MGDAAAKVVGDGLTHIRERAPSSEISRRRHGWPRLSNRLAPTGRSHFKKVPEARRDAQG